MNSFYHALPLSHIENQHLPWVQNTSGVGALYESILAQAAERYRMTGLAFTFENEDADLIRNSFIPRAIKDKGAMKDTTLLHLAALMMHSKSAVMAAAAQQGMEAFLDADPAAATPVMNYLLKEAQDLDSASHREYNVAARNPAICDMLYRTARHLDPAQKESVFILRRLYHLTAQGETLNALLPAVYAATKTQREWDLCGHLVDVEKKLSVADNIALMQELGLQSRQDGYLYTSINQMKKYLYGHNGAGYDAAVTSMAAVAAGTLRDDLRPVLAAMAIEALAGQITTRRNHRQRQLATATIEKILKSCPAAAAERKTIAAIDGIRAPGLLREIFQHYFNGGSIADDKEKLQKALTGKAPPPAPGAKPAVTP